MEAAAALEGRPGEGGRVVEAPAVAVPWLLLLLLWLQTDLQRPVLRYTRCAPKDSSGEASHCLQGLLVGAWGSCAFEVQLQNTSVAAAKHSIHAVHDEGVRYLQQYSRTLVWTGAKAWNRSPWVGAAQEEGPRVGVQQSALLPHSPPRSSAPL